MEENLCELFDRGLISRTCKELETLSKRASNLTNKWVKGPNEHFKRDSINSKTHEKCPTSLVDVEPQSKLC